jgi:lipoprotein-anchoring transpeptidase ErfK/SrfK
MNLGPAAAIALMSALLSTAAAAQTQASPSPTAKPAVPVISEAAATQVMLDRAGSSSGEIDGRTGINVKRALDAFQRATHLPGTGSLDDETWNALEQRAGPAPPLTSYVIADSDLAEGFSPDIPSDLMAQAKLPALGYRNVLEALAERFHASPDLLKKLNAGASFDRAGEQIMVPNVEAAPLTTAPANLTIVVSKSTSTLTLEDEQGAVFFLAPVTTGSTHDPLPIGRWKVTGVQQNPEFHYNPALFWDANPRHAKATLKAGPNNPVGTVWIDISKPHYGIHGTPEPSQIGHVESHGCVRMTNWDAQRVARWVRPGTPVLFEK